MKLGVYIRLECGAANDRTVLARGKFVVTISVYGNSFWRLLDLKILTLRGDSQLRSSDVEPPNSRVN